MPGVLFVQVSTRNNIDAVVSRMDGYKRESVDKAIPLALNRTGEMARTGASRELRSQGYALTASEIKDSITLIKASSGQRRVKLIVRRNTKSQMDYSPRESKAGVTVKIKGGRKLIKGAFIAQRLNGSSGVYVEDKKAGKTVIRRQSQYKRGSKGGWHAYPVRKLFGPSVGGVYATQQVQAAMAVSIRENFEARLEHELKRLKR